MKKYIVASHGGEEIYTPSLYSNKRDAYSCYAKALLERLSYVENIYKEEYQRYEDIFSKGSAKAIKSAITRLMKKYVNDNTIWKIPNGYAFGNNYGYNNYVLEIFEVEEI